MNNRDDQFTIFCGNLHEDVTEDILFELFLQAGPLRKVTIPQSNGKAKNFGFITFKHECSVTYAIELMGGVKLYGKPLRLQCRTQQGRDHQRSLSCPTGRYSDFREQHDGPRNMQNSPHDRPRNMQNSPQHRPDFDHHGDHGRNYSPYSRDEDRRKKVQENSAKLAQLRERMKHK